MREIAEILAREKLMQQVFVELNNFTELKPSIYTVVKYIKVMSGCESVAVRIKNGDGYPYYTFDGFPTEFIEHENDICLKDADGNSCVSEDGSCLLQCMCGMVISGNIDRNYDFFTAGGSFWTNNSSGLLNVLSKEDIEKLKIRWYCNECGYESVALIPIRHNGSIIGLLQINDKSKNKFDEIFISYMEMVGVQLGISIRNRMDYSDLLNKYNELKADCMCVKGVDRNATATF